MNEAQKLQMIKAFALVALSMFEDECIIDAAHMATGQALQDIDELFGELSTDIELVYLSSRIEERLGNEDCLEDPADDNGENG